METNCNLSIGQFVVIMSAGEGVLLLGEIVRSEPELTIKVQEHGPYSALRGHEYTVHRKMTAQLQEGLATLNDNFFETWIRPVKTGLHKWGATAGGFVDVAHLPMTGPLDA